MLKNFFLTALRTLWRSRGYSALNIAGFAIGIAAALLVILYVQYELSYDRWHKNAANIVKIEHEIEWGDSRREIGWTTGGIGRLAVEQIPEVHQQVTIRPWSQVTVENEKSKLALPTSFVDPSLFEMFDIQMVYGDPQAVLGDGYRAVLPRSKALTLFGDIDPTGQTIRINGLLDCVVDGVYQDLPENTYLPSGIYLSMDVMADDAFIGKSVDKEWDSLNYRTFLLLDASANRALIIDNLMRSARPLMTHWIEDREIETRLVRLTDLHLRGDLTRINLFTAIAGIILLIASINFMNLSTARSMTRAREVGVRKVMGAAKGSLIRQFLFESVLVTLTAFVLAILLVKLALPWFNNLLGENLTLSSLSGGQAWGALAVMAVVVGLLSGSYPAFYLASFNPMHSLKGGAGSTRTKGRLRRAMVIVQFSASVILIIISLNMYSQLRYMLSAELGFEEENVVYVRLRGDELRQKAEVLRDRFITQPRVETASVLSRVLGEITGGVWSIKRPHMDISLPIYTVFGDYNLIETFGLTLAEGRGFSREMATDPENAFLVNEAAAKKIGVTLPLETDVTMNGRDGNVVGILKDFHFQSLNVETDPIVFRMLRDGAPFDRAFVAVRFRPGPIDEAIDQIKSVWAEFEPLMPLEYFFLDEELNSQYRRERQLSRVMGLFTGFTMSVALLGLFGLAAFTTERRTKEIGVRKVLGADVPQIIGLLSMDFTMPVLIANVIAWPVAFIFLTRWLQDYPYRISLSLYPFIAVSLGVLVLSLAVVAMVSWRTANMNPTTTLRYE